MKLKPCLLLCILLMSVLAFSLSQVNIVNASGGETIIRQGINSGGVFEYFQIDAHHPSSNGNTSALAQIFRSVSYDFNITKASFCVEKVGNPTVNLTSVVYSNGNSTAIGPITQIVSSTPVNSSLLSASYSWVNWTFPSNYTFTNNTWYAVDIEASASGTIDNNTNYILISATSQYDDGARIFQYQNSAWFGADFSLWFTFYGYTGTVSVTLNSPVDGDSQTPHLVTFLFTPVCVGGDSIQNATLWTNASGSWTATQDNTTVITNNVQDSIQYTFTSTGAYNWTVQVFNTTASVFALSNRTITISSSAAYMAVTLGNPSYGASVTSTVQVTFTYTPVSIGNPINAAIQNSSLWINIYGTWQSLALNSTAVQNNTLNSFTYTFSLIGSFVWNVQVFNTTMSVYAPTNYTLIVISPTGSGTLGGGSYTPPIGTLKYTVIFYVVDLENNSLRGALVQVYDAISNVTVVNLQAGLTGVLAVQLEPKPYFIVASYDNVFSPEISYTVAGNASLLVQVPYFPAAPPVLPEWVQQNYVYIIIGIITVPLLLAGVASQVQNRRKKARARRDSVGKVDWKSVLGG